MLVQQYKYPLCSSAGCGSTVFIAKIINGRDISISTKVGVQKS